ncbi:MAG: sigma-70 family RNA polymerase sigma factor [Planctomycetales bacterium]|nr:sigma-70 family RNA polymerase sigma factor [Planctomycetales bacterium]
MSQLVAVARRISGNDELAAEAVQNALLKASKSWRSFRGESHVHTWLTQIVIHCVRDSIAAQRRRMASQPMLHHSESQCPHENVVDPERGPSQRLLDEELRRTIGAAVGQLPDRQREVFGLIVWQGMSAAEVGNLLEITPQTVHANLHAARKRLRELLNHLINEDQD